MPSIHPIENDAPAPLSRGKAAFAWLRWRILRSPEALSGLLAIALYAITVGGTWIYDDTFIAWDDPRLHAPRLWLLYFRQGFFPEGLDNLWRPLTSLSFALQWEIHGAMGPLFHLVNVLLHALACVLVARLGRALGGVRTAYVAGLLFAAHPIHVEAVAYLVGRAETMAAVGILAALLLFLDRPAGQPLSQKRVWGILGCFWFATLSKEQGLLVPAMLLAWAMVRRWRSPSVGGERRPPEESPITSRHDSEQSSPGTAAPAPPPISNCAAETPASPISGGAAASAFPTPSLNRTAARETNLLLVGLIAVTSAAYIAYRNQILPWFWESALLNPVMNPMVLKGADRWSSVVALIGRYAALVAAPVRLSIDYGLDVITAKVPPHDPYFVLGWVVLASYVILLAIAWRKRLAGMAGCLLCLGLSYLLISNVTIIGTIFNERLFYLPSVFVFLLIGLAAARLRPRLLVVVLTPLLILAALRTVTYASQWNNRLTFFEKSLQTQPKSAMLYLLLDEELEKEGKPREAARALELARRNAPDAWSVWYASARLSFIQGNMKEAKQFAMRGFDCLPGASPIINLLDRIRKAEKNRQAGQEPATKSLSDHPGTGRPSALTPRRHSSVNESAR